MTTPVRPYYYTGTASCPTGEMTDQQCLFPDNLPSALPRVWEADSTELATTTFEVGDKVFFDQNIYVCIRQHAYTNNTAPNVSTTNWERLNLGLERLQGDSGAATFVNGLRDIRFTVNEITSGNSSFTAAIDTDPGTDSFDALVTLNLNASSGVGTDVVGRDQLDFAAGTTETTGRIVVLTGTNELTTIAPTIQTGGFNTAGRGLADEGSNTVGLDLYPQKVALFMGTTDGVARTSAAPIAGAMRTYNTFTTQRVPYYFIPGINIDDAQQFADGGAGVWTTDDPAVVVNPANSANLIGQEI